MLLGSTLRGLREHLLREGTQTKAVLPMRGEAQRGLWFAYSHTSLLQWEEGSAGPGFLWLSQDLGRCWETYNNNRLRKLLYVIIILLSWPLYAFIFMLLCSSIKKTLILEWSSLTFWTRGCWKRAQWQRPGIVLLSLPLPLFILIVLKWILF